MTNTCDICKKESDNITTFTFYYVYYSCPDCLEKIQKGCKVAFDNDIRISTKKSNLYVLIELSANPSNKKLLDKLKSL